MLFIFIEIRYQRQLARICPEALASFHALVDTAVSNNGGAVGAVSQVSVCRFEESSVGFAFSTARAVAGIHDALEAHRRRIREYRVIIGSVPGSPATEALVAAARAYDRVVLPDSGILVTPEAANVLAAYMSFIDVPDVGLSLYAGARTVEYAAPASNGQNAGRRPTLYAVPGVPLASALVNLMALYPRPEPEGEASEDECLDAPAVWRRYRFEREPSRHRVEALQAALRSYFIARGKGGATILVPPGSPLLSPMRNGAVDPLEQVLREHASFVEAAPQAFLPCSLKGMPSDLRDLAYLTYLCARYLYADETPAFFSFLGKESGFAKALGSWLYSNGLLADQENLLTLNYDAIERLERGLDDVPALRRRMGDFLWSRYLAGELVPSRSLAAAFDELGFSYPDSFALGAVYRESRVATALGEVGPRLDPEVNGAAVDLERAYALYETGGYEDASSLVKEALHVFQGARVVAGEFRALLGLALLSFAQGKTDDASVYLDYAREDAERMRDPFFVNATRFESAMVHLVQGGLTAAGAALDLVSRSVEAEYEREWEALVLFMKGRVAFELGNYRNAELLFQTAASVASVNQVAEAVPLCRTWYARAQMHQNRFASAEGILASCAEVPDAALFLAEGHILAGRATGPLVPADELEAAYGRARPWSIHEPSWASGFAAAEDRCYGSAPERRIALRLYAVYSRFHRWRFESGADPAALVAEIEAIARDAIALRDPNAALYYYFCYEICARTQGLRSADTITYLSRGFKYLQKRSDKIDDNAVREQFMQANTWNARLYRAARENMLI